MLKGCPTGQVNYVKILKERLNKSDSWKLISVPGGALMKKFSFGSIKSQLFVMVFIMALFAAGIIVYFGVSFRKEQIRNATRDSALLADSLFNEHENVVADVRQLMLTLAELPEIKNHDISGIRRILKKVLGANPRYSNIIIADRKGRILASAVHADATNVSDRMYFINALATGRFSVGEFIRSRFTGKPVLVFAYPLKNEEGKIRGIIAMGIDMRYYKTLLDTMPLPSGSSYLLLDHKGTIMTRGINPADFVGEQYGTAAFKSMLNGPDKDTFIAVAHDGIRRFISYRKIRLEGDRPPYMYIRSGIPVNAVLSVANRTLMRNLALFAVSLCLVIFCISFIAKHSIIDRIALLETASRRLADGDMNFKVSDLVPGGELGRLGLNFDHMAHQIGSREEALRESEQRYRALFEQSPFGVLLFDEEGKFLDFNRAAHRDLGYTREEFADLTIDDIDPDESAEDVKSRMSRILEEGGAEFEVRHLSKQGEMRDVHVITRALALSGRSVFHAIWRDITEQKKAEGAMHLQSEIAKNISEGIYLVSAKDLRIVYANPKVEEMFGYGPGEMEGKHVSIVNAPTGGDPVRTASQIEEALKTTGAWRGEVLNMKKDGTTFWGHASVSMLDHPEHGEVYVSLQTDISESKRAEEALRQSEEKFRSVFASATDAIFILDMEGNVLDVNKTAYERLGYTREEMLSMSISQLDSPDFREKISERIEFMGQGGNYKGELAHLRKDGTVMPVEVNARVTEIEGKKVILSFVRDITERRNADEALRESRATLQQILDTVPQSIFWKDRESVFLGCNASFARAVGIEDARQIVGKTDFDLPWPKAEAEAYRADDRDVVTSNLAKRHIIEPLQQADGARIWADTTKVPLLDNRGSVYGLLGVYEDITQRKQADEKLKKSERQLRASQEVARLGSWDLDLVSEQLEWSSETYKLFDKDPAEFVPSFGGFERLVHPDDLEIMQANFNKALGSGDEPYHVTVRIINDSGREWVMEAFGALRRDENGNALSIFGTAQDITEQKKIEERVRSALREKETLLRELYHRTKNNMQVIMSLINLQIASVPNKKDVLFLNDTKNRIMSMALVHEKLYVSGDLSNVNLKTYVDDLLCALLRSYKLENKKIVLVIEVDDMLLSIDTIMPLGLIITELTTNTLKYAFPGNCQGEIRISAHLTQNDEMEMSYSDNGIGFPADFDIEKADTLGLRLVYNLVTSQLQGHLTLKADEGPTFIIRFKEPATEKRI